VIQVDYSNEESFQHALTGVEVVISTIPGTAVDIQVKIAAAAKNQASSCSFPRSLEEYPMERPSEFWARRRMFRAN